MEEKIMKRIAQETRENLEKGAQEPKKIMDEHSRYPPFGVRFVTLRRSAVALLLGSRFRITLRA